MSEAHRKLIEHHIREIGLCSDHDEDCPSIFAEGGCLDCWLYDPSKGFCPYLRPTDEPIQQFAEAKV